MQIISLFSGIGGFELAGEWMGWQPVLSCEINPFGQKVLKYYWPNAFHHDDIYTLTKKLILEKSNWKENEPTVLVGGFPCQPYSHAGKRLGKEDDRHLWPEMRRAIREIQPAWVVGENVSGLISWNGGMVFNEVQTDLEAEGYEVFPVVLPACAVNAPHRRDRVWFIAYSNYKRNATGFNSIQKEDGEVPEWNNDSEFGNASPWIASDTCNEGLQGGKEYRSIGEIGQVGNEQFAGHIPPNFKNFPTQPPVCSRNDGISPELVGITVSKHRNESIKAYGNAIVPQVALQIFKAIEQMNLLVNQ